MKTSMVIVCLAIVGCGKSKLTYSRSQSSQADKEQYSNATPIVVENPSQNYNIPAPVEPRVVAPPTIIRPIQQQPSIRPQPARPPVPQDGQYQVDVGGLYGATAYVPKVNKKFPVIIWGNGCKSPSMLYRSMLTNVAKQGYVIIQYGRDLSNSSDCQANSDFYLPLTQLASQIRRSPHSRMDSSKIIFAGHSMGGSAAIKASRNYSSTSAVVAFTPCVYYDKNYGGLPKPSLILEAGSYTVFGQDYTSTCDWQSHYSSIRSSSNRRSIYGRSRQSNHRSPMSSGVFSSFLVDYLDCYVRSKSNKCSNLKRRSGWYIL